MEFIAKKKEAVILDPSEDMARKTIGIEIRKDPLTGRTSRICHFMKFRFPKPNFEKLVAQTESTCPFCPERIMKVTACFPAEIVPGGRMVLDDMVLFPNIFPYDSLGAIATMGPRHFIPMVEIEPERITKAFRLGMSFFQRVQEMGHPEAVYHVIHWNHLPASGSSIVHPHMQVFSTSSAPYLMQQELDAAKAYLKTHGTNYWDDLVAVESKGKERFLGRIGRTTWLTSFAPIGVAGDVLAVVEGARCSLELTDNDLRDIAAGLTRTMAAYDKVGIESFNMSFFTGAWGDDHMRFHLLFSPRIYFNQALGAPDANSIRNLCNESICTSYPEDINKHLLSSFT